MILLKPDMPPADLKDKKLVFLAGPIMGAENWQARAAADLAHSRCQSHLLFA